MSTSTLRAAKAQAATEDLFEGADIADWRPEDERFWALPARHCHPQSLDFRILTS